MPPETESTPDIKPSNTNSKPVLSVALAAIILAASSFIFTTHIFYTNLKNKIELQKSIAALSAEKPAQEAQPISSLQNISTLNIHPAFIAIQNLIREIQTLSPLPTNTHISLQNTMDKMKVSDQNLPWYRRVLESLKQLKTLFIVRHLDHPSTPLIAPDMENYLKQNIITQLTFAQWGLLHQDAKIYHASLKTASQWITQYFSLSKEKNTITDQLNTLEKVNFNALNENTLNVVPSIKNEAMPVTQPVQKKSAEPKKNSPLPENNTQDVET